MRTRTIVPVLVIAMTGLGACGEDESPEARAAGFPMTVQSCDREVTIERPPERILTQGAEAPVFVAAAGAADRIVARNSEFGSPLGQYAQALQDVPVIGETGSTDLSRESIIAQNPDLVINRGPGNDLPPDVLGAVGIDTFVVSGRCTANDSGIKADGSFDQIYADLERFGRIFGTEAVAADAVADLRRRVVAVQQQATRTPEGTTAAAVNVEGKTVGSYGNQATIQTQMATLGLRNVFGDQDQRYFEVSVEAVIARDPDVLIVVTNEGSLDARQVVSQPEFASLRAVRDGRVLSVHFGLTVASPLAVEGLEQLAEQLAR